MRLAFFGYAWNVELQPDAYMQETIDSFTRAGFDVDLYFGAQLAREYGIFGLNPKLSVEALTRFIAAQGYDGAISFNNSMLIPEVRAAVNAPIATVIVDEPEHMFDYRHQGPFEPFNSDVQIVAMSSAVEGKIKAATPGVEPRLHFMLPATHIDPAERLAKRVHAISWVASYVGDLNLDQYLKLMIDRPDYHALTIKCLGLLQRHGNLKTIKAEDGMDMLLIGGLPWTFDFFETQMQNILTNRSRVEVVERLAPHGLALFGNAGWQKLLTYSAPVMAALRSGEPVKTHADLRRVYNASKLSINLPQAHIATGAIQYRVIDVMASSALLITRRDANSDLYRAFGKDCPVPVYSDLDELERLCAHYLANESERRDLVNRCNALIDDSFDFRERAKTLLGLVGLAPTPGAVLGAVRRVDLNPFTI
ncbi:MAG TPA: glycosyltransferase [Phenylobacterium sp.]|nr:glycosyltransferase [Phenylobacterium sp.]